MRTLQLIIAYEGTRYAGWQRQKSSSQHLAPSTKQKANSSRQKATIQETVEAVLERILQEPVRVVASGRTDAGVHAQAQAAHLKTHAKMPVARLFYSANQLLPKDIAILKIRERADSFHARFDAVRKQYRYRVFTGGVVPPFIRPYVCPFRAPLDLPRMRQEVRLLKGRHDFKAFVRAGGRRGSTVRTLYAAKIAKRHQELHFEFEADGFLHTMVRSMVGTLLDIGRGRLPSGTIKRMLKIRKRCLAGTTAPACGLTLMRVHYRR